MGRKRTGFDKKAYGLEYYKTHKAQVRAHNQRYKRETFAHYTGGDPKCAHCGITDIDVLCLDHINGGGKQHRKEVGSGVVFYRWLFHNNYPEGYQVLCFNCNMKKRISKGV